MGEYRPLGHDGEGDVSTNGMLNHESTVGDDISVIKPDGSLPHHMEPMSPLRKVSFILSILLCGLTIVVFLWVLPCDCATCPSVPLKSGTKSWERTLRGLELKGGISVVAGVPGRGRNLVFLAQGDIINAAQTDQNLRDFPASRGGLVSLIGSTGEVAWYIRFLRTLHTMDCSLIDVTGDGAEDCIVVGTGKLLAAVDPIPGNIVWYLHNHQNSNRSAVDLEFPIVLPDLDGDGVRELVTACSFNDTSERPATLSDRNNFIIISGKMGRIIGEAVNLSSCAHIQDFSVDEKWNIVYTCQEANKEASTGIISVQELYANATHKQLNVSTYLQSPPLRQYQVMGVSSTVKKVNGRWLTLMNEGHCPNHCNVTVKVTDERRDNETVWNFQHDNTYGMVPAVLVFNNHSGTSTSGALVEPVSGFVLKFWTWTSTNSHMPSSMLKQSDTMSTMSSNPLFRYRLKRSVRYRHLGGERFIRSVITPLKQSVRNGSDIQVDFHQLKERVVLYTFNATDNHIVNASLNDVTQLCFRHGPSEEDQFCQPDLSFQEQSLLIADLDQDGSQELISYLTTYTTNNPEGSSVALDASKWHLQSRVRVVRLEAELPKLYEAVARQVMCDVKVMVLCVTIIMILVYACLTQHAASFILYATSMCLGAGQIKGLRVLNKILYF
ncbi:uncharacterized protein LOC110838674 isoform X3 [Zootermopsis nevadensis]|nr:uncharacterized protein LOC110838674 isoform X3 [Zootermopsis nevadensis]